MRRLTSREQFQAILAGPIVAKTEHFALHRLAPPVSPPARPLGLNSDAWGALFPGGGVWLGAMVPKRWAKRAVTRNLIKRQIHHVSALQQSSLAVAAHVVRLRTGFSQGSYPSAASKPLRELVAAQLAELYQQASVRLVANVGR